MSPVVNIAAYLFVNLDDLAKRQSALRDLAGRLDLKGTVLLAAEGINLVLAGTRESIADFLAALCGDPLFAALHVKTSYSDHVPFKRLRIKIKNEIIRMDRPAIRPQAGRAPSVDAPTLARWLERGTDDAGRPLALLDTRNAFEVDAGTFDQAIDWRIGRFTEFPAAFDANKDALQGKTVVSFCTGGIRCEKAALYMAEQGLADVYQLEGGILQYFEQTGGKGFSGNCFVFDERETLTPALSPAAN